MNENETSHLHLCTESGKIDKVMEYMERGDQERELMMGEIKSINESNQRIFELYQEIKPTIEELKSFMAKKEALNGNTEKRMDQFDQCRDVITDMEGQMKMLKVILPLGFSGMLVLIGILGWLGL